MSDAFYEGKREGVVKSLMTKYGTTMDLVVTSEGTFDPTTGAVTGTTTKTYKVLGLSEGFLLGGKGNTSVNTRKQGIYLSPSGMAVVPDVGHTLKVMGLEYYVSGVEIIAPGGVAVLYKLSVQEP